MCHDGEQPAHTTHYKNRNTHCTVCSVRWFWHALSLALQQHCCTILLIYLIIVMFPEFV